MEHASGDSGDIVLGGEGEKQLVSSLHYWTSIVVLRDEGGTWVYLLYCTSIAVSKCFGRRVGLGYTSSTVPQL